VIVDHVGILVHPYGRERSSVALGSGDKMYTFREVAMWILLGVLLGFIGGYSAGLKEGKREGFIRGKIASRRKAEIQ
jgi:hypothetical protein